MGEGESQEAAANKYTFGDNLRASARLRRLAEMYEPDSRELLRRSGINAELVTNLAVYCALAGILGAKILMIVFDWKTRFGPNPGQIFSLDTLQAAGVFQGGLILALITAYFYMRHQGLPLLAASDAFAPGVAGHTAPLPQAGWGVRPGDGERLLVRHSRG